MAASFRPSVLPDRDNDILSTFTRSFERARQRVYEDQANKRAQDAFDMQVEERDYQRGRDIIADEQEAARNRITVETTPGMTVVPDRTESVGRARAVDPIESALNQGVRMPAIPQFGIEETVGPDRPTAARDIGPEQRATFPDTRGLPEDIRLTGEMPGVGNVGVSDTLRSRTLRDRQFAEDEQRRNTALGYIDSGLLTQDDGTEMHDREAVERGDIDPDQVIRDAERMHGAALTENRQIALVRERAAVSTETAQQLDDSLGSALSAQVQRAAAELNAQWLNNRIAQDGVRSLMPGYQIPEIPLDIRSQNTRLGAESVRDSGGISPELFQNVFGGGAATVEEGDGTADAQIDPITQVANAVLEEGVEYLSAAEAEGLMAGRFADAHPSELIPAMMNPEDGADPYTAQEIKYFLEVIRPR